MRLTSKNKFNEYVDNNCIIPQSNNIIDKLGQLEDIEEELGIDLITLFKALSCGVWERGKDNVLNFDDCKLLYKRIQIGSNVYWLSNYGKTWALTKEELEK